MVTEDTGCDSKIPEKKYIFKLIITNIFKGISFSVYFILQTQGG